MTAAAQDNGAWIRRFHPAPDAATRLVCFPHAGGSASYFFPVSRSLEPTMDVLAVQYPGRQDRRRETPIDDVPRLADAIVDELGPWSDRPLILFGHSLGATVAFEVARRLENLGTVPLGLFASGRRAPTRTRDEWVHQRGDDDLVAEIATLAGTDAQVLGDPELVRMILPAFRADYKAAETYRYHPGPKLSCPIVSLIGDADPQVTSDEADDWREHTTGGFELHVYPGGHFYLNHHTRSVLERLTTHATSLPAATQPR